MRREVFPMTKTMKQSIAVFAIIAQLLVLLPFSIIIANAEDLTQQESDTPVLNETIVGTLKFQSFNFLGSNSSDRNEYYDGVDYTSTFYYSDDYFSSSAVNEQIGDSVESFFSIIRHTIKSFSIDSISVK